jgi:hypothetical protein
MDSIFLNTAGRAWQGENALEVDTFGEKGGCAGVRRKEEVAVLLNPFRVLAGSGCLVDMRNQVMCCARNWQIVHKRKRPQ